jgi:hypothetical protein
LLTQASREAAAAVPEIGPTPAALHSTVAPLSSTILVEKAHPASANTHAKANAYIAFTVLVSIAMNFSVVIVFREARSGLSI